MFTINNPEGMIATDDWESVRGAVWQHEVGEQGTPHYQGYIVLKRASRFPAVKRLLGSESAHLDVARGTQSECVAYVTKEDTRVEGPYWYPDEATVRGTAQGTRSDLKRACEQVLAGDLDDKLDPVTYCRAYRGLAALRAAHNPPIMRPLVTVLCIFGPPGIGKSTAVWEYAEKLPYKPCITESGTIWFDGYAGQETLFLDDFKGLIPIHVFNSICDRFPYLAPYKGGFVAARWTHVIIVTNVKPDSWYAKFGQRADEVEAVYRRVGYGTWTEDPHHSYVEVSTREELAALFHPPTPPSPPST